MSAERGSLTCVARDHDRHRQTSKTCEAVSIQTRVSYPNMNSINLQLSRSSACTAAGDRVPGPRSFALMAPVKFPWRATVNSVEDVGSEDSYKLSLELSRVGLICGPSSGLNLKGM